MSVGVVDRLESVHVDKYQAERYVRSQGDGARFRHGLVAPHAVVGAGQRVYGGEALKLPLILFPLGNVHRRLHVDEAAVDPLDHRVAHIVPLLIDGVLKFPAIIFHDDVAVRIQHPANRAEAAGAGLPRLQHLPALFPHKRRAVRDAAVRREFFVDKQDFVGLYVVYIDDAVDVVRNGLHGLQAALSLPFVVPPNEQGGDEVCNAAQGGDFLARPGAALFTVVEPDIAERRAGDRHGYDRDGLYILRRENCGVIFRQFADIVGHIQAAAYNPAVIVVRHFQLLQVLDHRLHARRAPFVGIARRILLNRLEYIHAAHLDLRPGKGEYFTYRVVHVLRVRRQVHGGGKHVGPHARGGAPRAFVVEKIKGQVRLAFRTYHVRRDGYGPVFAPARSDARPVAGDAAQVRKRGKEVLRHALVLKGEHIPQTDAAGIPALACKPARQKYPCAHICINDRVIVPARAYDYGNLQIVVYFLEMMAH